MLQDFLQDFLILQGFYFKLSGNGGGGNYRWGAFENVTPARVYTHSHTAVETTTYVQLKPSNPDEPKIINNYSGLLTSRPTPCTLLKDLQQITTLALFTLSVCVYDCVPYPLISLAPCCELQYARAQCEQALRLLPQPVGVAGRNGRVPL